jgi:hypothetical protein
MTAVLLAGAPLAAQGPSRAERIQVIQRVMQGEEAKFEKQLATKGGEGSTRDVPNAALLMLRAQRPVGEVEAMLDRAFNVQNMDPASKSYGSFPWQLTDTSVSDANAIEFTTQPMGAIFIRYGDRLSTGFLQKSRPHLEAAMVALSHHIVKVSYTNIFVMNTINTLILAQYLHDDASMARGRAQWDQWRAYTAASGIHEFNSPTYYATDLADLTYGHLYITDPTLHQQIVEAEDLIWTDICAHYFPAGQRLAGAESRTYQFLNGRGSLEMNLFLEGLFNMPADKFTDPYLEKVAILENERPGAYRPSAAILALATQPERSIAMRYDANPAYVRTTYITPTFALGTSTGAYGAQDRMFAADLAGAPVAITVAPDVFGSPYGVKKQKDKSGHSKPEHLPANLSAAQDKGLALLVFDLDPRAAAKGDEYATSLVLPAHPTEILLNGAAVKPTGSLDQKADANAVVALRFGGACFAARVFAAEPLDGKAPTYALRADSDGWHSGAIRFVVQHATSKVTSSQEHLHVALLVEASACGETGLAAASARLASAELSAKGGDTFTAKAKVGDETLEVKEDGSKRLPSARKVNGKEMPAPFFDINGKPAARLTAPTS